MDIEPGSNFHGIPEPHDKTPYKRLFARNPVLDCRKSGMFISWEVWDYDDITDTQIILDVDDSVYCLSIQGDKEKHLPRYHRNSSPIRGLSFWADSWTLYELFTILNRDLTFKYDISLTFSPGTIDTLVNFIKTKTIPENYKVEDPNNNFKKYIKDFANPRSAHSVDKSSGGYVEGMKFFDDQPTWMK